MQWTPHITVAAIIEEAGRFLMVEEEINGQPVYNQPAGHLEKDETLLDAVKREVQEETARQFTPEYLIGIYLFSPPNADASYLRVCFAGQCNAPDPHASLDTSIIQALWLSRAELLAAPDKLRTELVLRCIDDYLQARRYPLELLQHL